MNKKSFIGLNSFLLIFSVTSMLLLCSCGKKQEPEMLAGLPNPMHECTEEELAQATGIALTAPEGASDVKYFYIDSGESAISQVIFTLDGKNYCYRAQPTSFVSIEANVNENASVKDLSSALNDCTNIGATLSGMHYDWECVSLIDIAESRDAVVAFNEGKEGFIAWLDVVPGVLYSLSVEKGASQELLMNTAEVCFVPLQGDVG